jgi:hypothetical protein
MPSKLIPAVSIYSVVLISFFFTGTPAGWACTFGVIASCISYFGGLKL